MLRVGEAAAHPDHSVLVVFFRLASRTRCTALRCFAQLAYRLFWPHWILLSTRASDLTGRMALLTTYLIGLEVAHSDRPELFVRKLNQCSVVFDFNDASSELKGKQIKAAALHDMLEYITTQRGVITENVYPEVVKMVRISSRVLYV